MPPVARMIEEVKTIVPRMHKEMVLISIWIN